MEMGGQFISLLNAATNPDADNQDTDREHSYAKHLVEIVRAFQEIASFELKNNTSKNIDRITIKKARRIEITNADEELPCDMVSFYKGLIRYGIFVRDYRGKSIRGKVVPRLVLRGLLIPYFKLTFSKRDSIQMSWKDFIEFLQNPTQFRKIGQRNSIVPEIRFPLLIMES
jgi:hypothetical protein